MNANRTAQLSLVLSVITLVVVLVLLLVVAGRPAPAPYDDSSLQARVGNLRADIAALRTMVEAGAGESAAGDIVVRLDRVEAAVTQVGAKLDAICAAIQASPFAPSGFACP